MGYSTPTVGSCHRPKIDRAWCGQLTGRCRVTPSVPACCYGATSPRGLSGPPVIDSKAVWAAVLRSTNRTAAFLVWAVTGRPDALTLPISPTGNKNHRSKTLLAMPNYFRSVNISTWAHMSET